MTSGQYSCRSLDAPEPRSRSRRCADLIFVVSADPFAVLVRHRRTRLRIGIQPVQNQCFDNSLRIGKVLGAVIFECLEHGCIEAVGPLDRLGLVLAIG